MDVCFRGKNVCNLCKLNPYQISSQFTLMQFISISIPCFFCCLQLFVILFFNKIPFFFFLYFLLSDKFFFLLPLTGIMWTETTWASAEEDQTKLWHKWSHDWQQMKGSKWKHMLHAYLSAAIIVSWQMFVCLNILAAPEQCALSSCLGNLWKQWWHFWMTFPCALDWMNCTGRWECVRTL